MTRSDPSRITRVMDGSAHDPAAKLLRLALHAATPAYRLGLRFDQQRKAKRAQPLGRPTVSVGNLTAGGTGKTPFTVDLVRRLQTLGHRPAVLLRGYRAADPHQPDTADEARLYRQTLGPDVPVHAHAQRVVAASAALDAHPDTTCFVLDDGFQHRQANRDLDLVLIDATRPFGFGHLLPRGLLREPLAALARADAVIITRADHLEHEALRQLSRRIEQHHGQPPLAHAVHAWTHLQHDSHTLPIDALAQHDAFALTALGNPQPFLHQLQSHARQLVGQTTFPDHHPYTRDNLQSVFKQAHAKQASAVVTTEKDFVKLAPLLSQPFPAALPLLRPQLAIQITQGQNALDQRLAEALPTPKPS